MNKFIKIVIVIAITSIPSIEYASSALTQSSRTMAPIVTRAIATNSASSMAPTLAYQYSTLNKLQYPTYQNQAQKYSFISNSAPFGIQTRLASDFTSNDPYKILDISPNSTLEEIKKARLNLLLKYHPDINKKDTSAIIKAQKINNAYDQLSKPNQNNGALYDNAQQQSYNPYNDAPYSNAQQQSYNPYNEPTDYSGDNDVYYARKEAKWKREEAVKAAHPRYLNEAFAFASDEKIRQFIRDNNIDINKRDNEPRNYGRSYTYNQLGLEILNNNLSKIKLLISLGADVNISDSFYEEHSKDSPLIMACKKNRDNSNNSYYPGTTKDGIIMALIKAGGDVNATDTKGNSPLLLLIENGFYIHPGSEGFISFDAYRNTIQELIYAGADVNHANNNGLTPLKALKNYFNKRSTNEFILLKGCYDQVANILKKAGAKEIIDNSAKQYSDFDASGW